MYGRSLPLVVACLALVMLGQLLAPPLAPPAAHADVGPPISVRLTDLSAPAESGETITATLEIEAGPRLVIEELRCEGDGRDLRSFHAPQRLELGPGEIARLPLRATPADPTAPLLIACSVSVAGQKYTRSYDLSRQAFEAAAHGRAATVTANAPPLTGGSSRHLLPAPPADRIDIEPEPAAALALRLREAADTPPQVPARDSYEIEVLGQFAYYRPDTSLAFGAYGVTVRVYDEDFGPDQLLGQTVVGQDGYYYVTFTWDPCPTCDQTPDLYVEFEAANTHFEIQEPGFWRTNYTWRSATSPNYTGTLLELGGMSPGN